jgi:Ankyrin repeats (3 copies)
VIENSNERSAALNAQEGSNLIANKIVEPKPLPQDEMWKHFVERQKTRMKREWESGQYLSGWWKLVMEHPSEVSEVNAINGHAAVHGVDSQGRNPIFVAVMFNQVAAVKTLINKNDFALDVKDKQGNTSLHYAAGLGLDEIANVLLDSGSDENARNVQGQTPAALALMCKNYALADSLGMSEQSAMKQVKKQSFSQQFKKQWTKKAHKPKSVEYIQRQDDGEISDEMDMIGLFTENAHLPPQLRPLRNKQNKINHSTKSPFVADFNSMADPVTRRAVRYEPPTPSPATKFEVAMEVDTKYAGQTQEHAQLSNQVNIVYKKDVLLRHATEVLKI